ncbi:unnamed protein product [Cladocopium goreaui]|uniref:TFIIS N-terminal domain-containing protein n=1 Tax=Cladocopium goreaui TaxID=2562237 RepID=A0A9P1BZX0_9DINO|nr:unnamed protein product [Cladocopium goreaui]
MEGDAGEITLQYVAVSSVEKLGEVLKRQCGTSKDFWFGTVVSSEHQELASKLPGLHVGPFWAAEAFTHCYASQSADPDADFAALTNRYGLGQRSKKPGRKCGAPGMIYLLLNQSGFSKLYKYNMELAAAPKAKVTKASKGDARKALGKRSKGSRASKTQPIDAELILDEATSPQQKKSRTAVVNDPLASPWPSSRSRRHDTPDSPRLSHAANKHDLHRRQVAVIQKRLEELLPSLPLDQLSTSWALTKLEESMRKRKGKFDEFRADVERIIIAYVTKKSAAKAIAARKKKPVEEESAKTATSTQAEHGNEDEEVPSTMTGPQTEDVAEDLDVAEPKELVREAPEVDIPRTASQAVSPVQIDLETQELSDHEILPDAEEMVEVDHWGFQVALSQLRECAGRPPSDAIAILTALLASRPSQELLSFGAWEAALGAHERMTSNRRVARLARKVKERWKAMDDAKKEQMLYRKALTAIEQLKTLGDDNAPSPES